MIDERDVDAEDVRAWLAGVEAPVPRLDVGRTLATGRARQRRRRQYRFIVTAGMTVAVVAAAVPAVAGRWRDTGETALASPSATVPASPTAPAFAGCRMEPLQPPAGLGAKGVKDPKSVDVSAMDPTGRYVVGGTYGGFNASPAAVRWDNGVALLLPTPWEHVQPTAVNASGVVIGSATQGNEKFRGWVYRDGVVTELPPPAGYNEVFEPVGINARGDIVGNANSADHKRHVVVIWPAGNPKQPRILIDPPDQDTIAAGIADDGTVVGWFTGQRGAYIWDGAGNGRPLALLPGSTSAYIAGVHWPWAFGSNGENSDLMVRWDLRTGTPTVLDLPGGHPNPGKGLGVTDINPAGDLVTGDPRGALLHSGKWVKLPAPDGGFQPNPVAISDDGRTLAGSVYFDPTSPTVGKRYPVMWRC